MERDEHMMRVRLPADLHQELIEAARSNKRSVNAEIVSRLSSNARLDTDWLKTTTEYLNTIVKIVRLSSERDSKADLLKKNFRLLASAAQAFCTLIEDAERIIGHRNPASTERAREEWLGMLKLALPMITLIKKTDFLVAAPDDVPLEGPDAETARVVNARMDELFGTKGR
jgi:hypothetical protein